LYISGNKTNILTV